MMHIFWVHSSITYLMAMAVIEKENLCSSKVIVLLDRNYNPSSVLPDVVYKRVEDISNLFSPITLNKLINLSENKATFDDFILDFILGNSYIAYIPQVMDPKFQMLITHPNCRQYHFIEEGLANYKTILYTKPSVKIGCIKSFAIKLINLFVDRISFGHAFLKPYIYVKNITPKYYLHDNSFNRSRVDIMDIILVQWPKNVSNHKLQIPTGSCIIVLSPLVEFGLVSVSLFNDSLKLIVKSIISHKLNKSNVYVKYHPSQSLSVKQQVASICISCGFEPIVLSDSLPFEQLISANKGLCIYGYESSLLFYSSISNNKHEVFSVYKFIQENNRKNKALTINLEIFKDIEQL